MQYESLLRLANKADAVIAAVHRFHVFICKHMHERARQDNTVLREHLRERSVPSPVTLHDHGVLATQIPLGVAPVAQRMADLESLVQKPVARKARIEFRRSHFGIVNRAFNVFKGLHVVFARPFHFTGPHHSRRFVIPSITYQLVKIKYYGTEPTIYSGSLDISRDVIDVRDVARGMIQLLNQSEPGEAYNLCCGKSYTFRELTEMLVDIAGVSVDFRFDPGYERSNDIPLLIGNPEKAMSMGWKPMISIEDCLTDLFNEMVLRRRTELKLGMGQDLRL